MLMLLAASVLYLSPVIGTGTDADPYRVALGSYSTGGGVACIPSLPSGQPRFTWGRARVKVSTPTDLTHLAFPLKNLDESISLTVSQFDAIKAVMDARGIDTTGLTRTSTLRQVVQRVVDLLGSCPGFLDKGELP